MTRIKFALADILGKEIENIVVATRTENNPRIQIILIFSDDTYYEFYSDVDISMASGICAGDSETVLTLVNEWPDTETTLF